MISSEMKCDNRVTPWDLAQCLECCFFCIIISIALNASVIDKKNYQYLY